MKIGKNYGFPPENPGSGGKILTRLSSDDDQLHSARGIRFLLSLL